MVDLIASVLLLHGAGSSPAVFDRWRSHLDVPAVAADLHDGLDTATASMHDHADVAVRAAAALPRPLGVVGWSMGGLVAMLTAGRMQPGLLALLEPSPPAEVIGTHPDTALESGIFDPERVYGAFPAGQPARPESLRARSERKRGLSVPALPCPTLVVSGDEFPEDRGRRLAAHYGAVHHRVPGLDHWGLVTGRQVIAVVTDFFGIPAPEHAA